MIHQYVSNGYHIVLDVNSGCVHVVDELTYRVIPVVEEALAQNMKTAKELTAYAAGRMNGEGGEGPDPGQAQQEKGGKRGGGRGPGGAADHGRPSLVLPVLG